jgi:hypothetical protein
MGSVASPFDSLDISMAALLVFLHHMKTLIFESWIRRHHKTLIFGWNLYLHDRVFPVVLGGSSSASPAWFTAAAKFVSDRSL